jgi:hypothetical protein
MTCAARALDVRVEAGQAPPSTSVVGTEEQMFGAE